MLLEGGDGRNCRIFVPLDHDSIYAHAINAQRPQIFNDFRHDRTILKSLKQYVDVKKVFNVMFIPLQPPPGSEATKMLVLINQFKPRGASAQPG